MNFLDENLVSHKYFFVIFMVLLGFSEMYKLFAEPFCVMKQMAF